MSTVLVDANVLLDIVTRDPLWLEWSKEQVRKLAETSWLVINPIIFAEVSIGFSTLEEANEQFNAGFFQREQFPYDAGFLAGKAFVDYRKRGGTKRSPLPDFYIGAHAACRGYRLLTRDAARYRTYFPTVEIITPTKA